MDQNSRGMIAQVFQPANWLEPYLMVGLGDFVGYGQPLWLPHTGQAQGQPVHLVSTP